MELLLWAVGLTALFLFCMWMIIEADDYLVEESREPWKSEAKND